MKIIIDSAIPYIQGVFEPFAEVVYCSGGAFTPTLVADADALIIRTRTKCGESLLRGSKVRHIATATIGFDHIDLDYCRSNDIVVSSAAGCNARAVLHWVSTLLVYLSQREGWSPCDKRIGVVGVGNVGHLIEEYCRAWGFRVVCCDPPRAEAEGLSDFKTLEEVASMSDILTLHTPLTPSTYHFVDERILSLMPKGATLINTSRGEVIDTQALKNASVNYALDVWEGEPNIDTEVLAGAVIATYHIAGYSKQGKANGSAIVVGDISQNFSLPIRDWYPDVERVIPKAPSEISWEGLKEVILEHMDILSESEKLKCRAADFETLRNNYDYRCEKF